MLTLSSVPEEKKTVGTIYITINKKYLKELAEYYKLPWYKRLFKKQPVNHSKDKE